MAAVAQKREALRDVEEMLATAEDTKSVGDSKDESNSAMQWIVQTPSPQI